MKTKEIREELIAKVRELVDDEERARNARAAEERLEKKKVFREVIQDKFGYDVGTNCNSLDLGDFKLTIDGTLSKNLLAVKSCEKCGKKKTSHAIHSLDNLARVSQDKNWGFHICRLPIEEKQPTVAQRAFNILEELFDLFQQEREGRM